MHNLLISQTINQLMPGVVTNDQNSHAIGGAGQSYHCFENIFRDVNTSVKVKTRSLPDNKMADQGKLLMSTSDNSASVFAKTEKFQNLDIAEAHINIEKIADNEEPKLVIANLSVSIEHCSHAELNTLVDELNSQSSRKSDLRKSIASGDGMTSSKVLEATVSDRPVAIKGKNVRDAEQTLRNEDQNSEALELAHRPLTQETRLDLGKINSCSLYQKVDAHSFVNSVLGEVVYVSESLQALIDNSDEASLWEIPNEFSKKETIKSNSNDTMIDNRIFKETEPKISPFVNIRQILEIDPVTSVSFQLNYIGKGVGKVAHSQENAQVTYTKQHQHANFNTRMSDAMKSAQTLEIGNSIGTLQNSMEKKFHVNESEIDIYISNLAESNSARSNSSIFGNHTERLSDASRAASWLQSLPLRDSHTGESQGTDLEKISIHINNSDIDGIDMKFVTSKTNILELLGRYQGDLVRELLSHGLEQHSLTFDLDDKEKGGNEVSPDLESEVKHLRDPKEQKDTISIFDDAPLNLLL